MVDLKNIPVSSFSFRAQQSRDFAHLWEELAVAGKDLSSRDRAKLGRLRDSLDDVLDRATKASDEVQKQYAEAWETAKAEQPKLPDGFVHQAVLGKLNWGADIRSHYANAASEIAELRFYFAALAA